MWNLKDNTNECVCKQVALGLKNLSANGGDMRNMDLIIGLRRSLEK